MVHLHQDVAQVQGQGLEVMRRFQGNLRTLERFEEMTLSLPWGKEKGR